jgi:hypothetical protein
MANATITVFESDGVTETDVVVLDVGRQAAAASKSVAASTEDKAVLDAIAASLALLDNSIASGNELQVDIVGALPAGSAAIGKLAANSGVDIGDVDVTSVIPGTGATNQGKAVDSVAGATDTGIAILAVRDDSLTTLTPADGDYANLRVSSTGALHVTGGGGGTEYTEDVAAAADPSGQMMMAVRRDTLSASEVSADGDNIALKATSKGQLHITIDDTQLSALGQTTAAASVSVVPASDYVPPGTFVDDAVFTPGSSRVYAIGAQADETATDSVDEGDVGAPRMTLDRKMITTPQPHTAGGLSIFKSLDLDETSEEVKASAGQVYWIYAVNRTTSPLYLRLYNTANGSVTVGTTAHTFGPIEIPANASDHTAMMFSFGGMGVAFSTAIAAAVTTGFADNDTGAPGANHCIVNIGYK